MIQSVTMQRRRLVLVVEDQEINRDLLGEILEEDGYEVLYAENGRLGLEVIEEHLEDLSIILLDLMMPVMDGFEVLRRVKRSPRSSRIPVIVLTAEKSAELRALQMGAADFITKPFDMHEIILARVSRIIELSEGRQLIQATERDPLTNLYNRGFFYQYAERIVRFNPRWKMDAVVLDIERFRSVNNLSGREYGDRVLRLLGDEITAFLRTAQGIACRRQADQFFLFCRHREDYDAVLERFQSQMNSMCTRVNVRLRIGVCPWTEEADLRTMFDRARGACSMVRGNYKTHLMVYDEGIHRRELYYQRLLNDLRRAVNERQFVVYYQPKYDIQSDPPHLRSAEALIRWRHPELGMISPGDFIPLFERSGMIEMVDTYVWTTAAEQIAHWRDTLGFLLPVSVNLSRTDVFNPLLEQNLVGLMERNGLCPSELKLEVTESAYTDDAEQLIAVIDNLRARGFQVEMDDFGSGYSSLNMLSTLPIDVLKMDMKFIQNIEKNDRDFRLVELILDIASYLNVPVVAEGVETENQLRLLRQAGCDLVQGYYFSRPLPPEEFEALIRKELQLIQEEEQK